MKVFLDSTKCSGYGSCADTCPSVFEVDEFGYAAVRNGGLVPEGDEARAGAAATSCPESAITSEA
jgi:ferredoxin